MTLDQIKKECIVNNRRYELAARNATSIQCEALAVEYLKYLDLDDVLTVDDVRGNGTVFSHFSQKGLFSLNRVFLSFDLPSNERDKMLSIQRGAKVRVQGTAHWRAGDYDNCEGFDIKVTTCKIL
jgi:hypothetical protein